MPAKVLRRLSSSFLYRIWARPRIRRHDEATVLGFRLTVPPGVFHPSLYFSSKILGRHIAALDLSGASVLDLGTGSGILALCAARAGARVVAADISTAAVSCAAANVVRNGYRGVVQVISSDLFAGLPESRQFDLVLWNPPFYPRDPVEESDRAWNAGTGFEVIRRFARHAEQFLAPAGRILLVLSSDVDRARFLDPFAGYEEKVLSTHRRLFETLDVVELRPRARTVPR